jgi:hypothetical protein
MLHGVTPMGVWDSSSTAWCFTVSRSACSNQLVQVYMSRSEADRTQRATTTWSSWCLRMDGSCAWSTHMVLRQSSTFADRVLPKKASDPFAS